MSGMAKAQWIVDPGHGYLRVPLATCEGLAISGYSFVHPAETWAYLEEDCDAPLWLDHHGVSLEGIPVTVCQRDATCRSYNRFRGAM